jgi:hypothetical protein
LTPPLYPPRAKNLALVLLAMTQFVFGRVPCEHAVREAVKTLR